MNAAREERYAGLSGKELDLIWRREQHTMTKAEMSVYFEARDEALRREAEPIPADVPRREYQRALHESSLADPDWAPRVVAHSIPQRPDDLIRVIEPDGSERVLTVQAIHAGSSGRAHFLELRTPDDSSQSWFLVREDGEPWSTGLGLDVDAVPASGWTAPIVGRWGSYREPRESPTVHVRVRHGHVKESEAGDRS